MQLVWIIAALSQQTLISLTISDDCLRWLSWQHLSFSHCPPQSLGSGNFLVTFSGVPAGDFVVRLRGEDSSSTSRSTTSTFQRQASTQIKTSSISVTVSAPLCIIYTKQLVWHIRTDVAALLLLAVMGQTYVSWIIRRQWLTGGGRGASEQNEKKKN